MLYCRSFFLNVENLNVVNCNIENQTHTKISNGFILLFNKSMVLKLALQLVSEFDGICVMLEILNREKYWKFQDNSV